MSGKSIGKFPESRSPVVVEYGESEPVRILFDWDCIARAFTDYFSTYPNDDGQKQRFADDLEALKRYTEERGVELSDDAARENLIRMYSMCAIENLRRYPDRFIDFGIQAALTAIVVKAEQMARKSIETQSLVTAAEVRGRFGWLVDEVLRLTHSTVGRRDKSAHGVQVTRENSERIKEQGVKAIRALQAGREPVNKASVARQARWVGQWHSNPSQATKEKLESAGIEWSDLLALARQN